MQNALKWGRRLLRFLRNNFGNTEGNNDRKCTFTAGKSSSQRKKREKRIEITEIEYD